MADAAAALADAAARFGFSATPRLDAELLMAHALGIPRERLLLDPPAAAPPGFAALVARRAGHEPIAYITGTRAFWTIDLAVDARVLVPRADTETLLEAAVAHFAGTPGPATVLDLGTGSGALLLAALDQWPAAIGFGIDASADAVAVARANAARLAPARARIDRGGWAHVPADPAWPAAGFDLLLCNPPYIAAGADLPREVAGWEPAGALYAGADGLDDLRPLAGLVPARLAAGGVACIEIGHDQGAAASALFAAAGCSVAIHHDLGGRDRCLVVTAG